MTDLLSLRPEEYPSLFVPLKAVVRSPTCRSKWERLVTQWRRRRLLSGSKVPRLAEIPSRPVRRVLSYLAALVVHCTPNRPSQLRRSIQQGNTLVVTGFYKLYFARCAYLLESARRFDPLLRVDCFVYLGARALCFTLSK